MADDNPLRKALPPAVDYLSYLTILEYNLTVEQLPVLHDILQDTTLTANIGWDLVHLLLPLLPESQSCLLDVARLGNPREVVLKVTELLERLSTRKEKEEDGEVQEDEGEKLSDHESVEPEALDHRSGVTPSAFPNIDPSTHAREKDLKSRSPPSRLMQFSVLVDMLAILHPRIKTKYPSRFLSTSLQAVLPAYANLLTDNEATEAVLGFVKTFSGSKRPRLPPRKSSTQILSQTLQQQQQQVQSAPDPEGSEERPAPEEDALQKRLLQSFLTFTAEGYISALPSDDSIGAMAWSSRLQEDLHPKKTVPGRRTAREGFEVDDDLHFRDTIMGRMLALTRDLNVSLDDLLTTLVEPDKARNEDSDDLPSSASDVPLSRVGCLYLLCGTIASILLFQAPGNQPSIHIFPTVSSILKNLFPSPSSGTVPLPTVDSLLFLGHYALETTSLNNSPNSDDDFISILQTLSLLSATTPSASLRYTAHTLTTSLLHLHPSPETRFSFIEDTIIHCPYETLKASAVGWLKDSILAANSASSEEQSEGETCDVFSTPKCLTSRLFLNPLEMSDGDFTAYQPFFMAVLNLVFLLLSSRALHARLDPTGETVMADIWLGNMETGVSARKIKRQEEGVNEIEDPGTTSGITLMESLIEMCKSAMGTRIDK
ncbi:MAG: hypothetical protein Q9220_000739 [cf. Caloplaca sp. 1 TL-2023]